MGCTHSAAAITDHAIHSSDGETVRYAWRGACIDCRHGVVGVTNLPADIAPERLQLLLSHELTSYLSRMAMVRA